MTCGPFGLLSMLLRLSVPGPHNPQSCRPDLPLACAGCACATAAHPAEQVLATPLWWPVVLWLRVRAPRVTMCVVYPACRSMSDATNHKHDATYTTAFISIFQLGHMPNRPDLYVRPKADMQAGSACNNGCLLKGTLCMQHLGVMVDACVVGPSDSPFLQQAADMTKGAYLRPGRSSALLQYLLVGSAAVAGWHPAASVSWVSCNLCRPNGRWPMAVLPRRLPMVELRVVHVEDRQYKPC